MTPIQRLRSVLMEYDSTEDVGAEERWARFDRGMDALDALWPAMLAVIDASDVIKRWRAVRALDEAILKHMGPE